MPGMHFSLRCDYVWLMQMMERFSKRLPSIRISTSTAKAKAKEIYCNNETGKSAARKRCKLNWCKELIFQWAP